MRKYSWVSLFVVVAVTGAGPLSAQDEVYPAAILPFQERGAGVKDYGQKISDILFAKLVVRPELMLVERGELNKILEEHELNLSGAVTPGQATQVGQLTGAKILISGSVIEVETSLYLVAKVIGTETSRVLGESVQGKSNDELGPLVEQLATKVGDLIAKQSDKLVAKPVKHEDRVTALKAKLGEAKRPLLGVRVSERHVGQATIDPAAQTELVLVARETGFEVVDPKVGGQKVDIAIEGEGFSEFALRRGNLVSVKARLEVKAIDRATDKVIAIDRQTAVVVDLTEQLAGKAALQEAAAQIATRLLPKLVK
jgi:curli biogenesis system outer membrane secretion channel CsgG